MQKDIQKVPLVELEELVHSGTNLIGVVEAEHIEDLEDPDHEHSKRMLASALS